MTRRATMLRSRLRTHKDGRREVLMRNFLAVEVVTGERLFRCRRCLAEVTRRVPDKHATPGTLMRVLRSHVDECPARPRGVEP